MNKRTKLISLAAAALLTVAPTLATPVQAILQLLAQLPPQPT